MYLGVTDGGNKKHKITTVWGFETHGQMLILFSWAFLEYYIEQHFPSNQITIYYQWVEFLGFMSTSWRSGLKNELMNKGYSYRISYQNLSQGIWVRDFLL
jgi:hypothetical protein